MITFGGATLVEGNHIEITTAQSMEGRVLSLILVGAELVDRADKDGAILINVV